MIDFLTHYYRRGTPPFRSLSALPDPQALQIMAAMYVEGSVIWERFKDPCGYLQARRRTEAWLRAAFIEKGGEPLAPYPVYMILGASRWVERMADPTTLATTAEIRVPLPIFQESDLSFTYPDSMVSAYLAEEKNPGWYQPGYHGQVFTLSEIRRIVAVKGLPEEGWQTAAPPDLAHYIEAQVWNHARLLEYLHSLPSL